MSWKPFAPLTELSAPAWGVRVVLAALAAWIGFVSIADTVANVFVKIDPELAHTLAPSDGQITSLLAERQFTLKPDMARDSESARLARLALRQDPTATKALTVLGLQAQLRGDAKEARRLFTYSQALSRREIRASIWAIEDAVERGDIPGALENYDIALRTSRTAADILFPVLANAISEPKVRSALLTNLAKQPVWRDSLISFLATRGNDPKTTILFFQEGKGIKLPINDPQRTSLVNALVEKGSINEAWSYYATFRPIIDQGRSRDPDFTQTPDTPSFFDWSVVSNSGATASIQRNEVGSALDFSAPPSIGGTVVYQLQMLPPGTYRLTGHSTGIEQAHELPPYWTLTCRDGRELGRVKVPNSSQSSGNFSGQFRVPSECRVQTLSFIVRPVDAIAGIAGQIDRVQLAPSSASDQATGIRAND